MLRLFVVLNVVQCNTRSWESERELVVRRNSAIWKVFL